MPDVGITDPQIAERLRAVMAPPDAGCLARMRQCAAVADAERDRAHRELAQLAADRQHTVDVLRGLVLAAGRYSALLLSSPEWEAAAAVAGYEPVALRRELREEGGE